MANRNSPGSDPLSLRPSNNKQADFSNVRGSSGTPDFSNVRSSTDTTPADRDIRPGDTRSYTVQAGDTLSDIAQRHFGRASRWHAIFEANRDQIDDPDRIFPGQVLRIPAIDTDGDGDLD